MEVDGEGRKKFNSYRIQRALPARTTRAHVCPIALTKSKEQTLRTVINGNTCCFRRTPFNPASFRQPVREVSGSRFRGLPLEFVGRHSRGTKFNRIGIALARSWPAISIRDVRGREALIGCNTVLLQVRLLGIRRAIMFQQFCL